MLTVRRIDRLFCDFRSHLLGNISSDVDSAAHKKAKLFSTESRHFTKRLTPPCYFSQNDVSDIVTETIIDTLEVIDV